MATATASTKLGKRQPAKVDRFRPDIQGLRAIAVVAVISNHVFQWPAGGFVGVDVFFVISGFLITGFLLREHETAGRISWGDFYRRRIRRLLPASTLVLAVTVAAAYFLYRTARFNSIRTDAVWSFFFASNWHFAAIGTDYWQASGPVSPLRHFWSLAVEEQFYIVWPVIIIAVLGGVGRLLRRRGRSPLPLLVAVVTLLTVASFVWGMHDTVNNPTAAYFSTFSRSWELGVGALLAAGAGQIKRVPTVVRSVLSWLGLTGIAASFTFISNTTPFPAPAAALPVLASALVIAAGIGGTPRFAFLLTNRVSGYIGNISYSLYLWHFPVVILLPAALESAGRADDVIALILMLVLSSASFHLVEDPVRRSKWLDPGAKRRNSSHRRGVPPVIGYSALAVLTLIMAVLVVFSLQTSPSERLAVSEALTANQSPQTTAVMSEAISNVASPVVSAPQAALSSRIDAGLAATAWPAVTVPSLDAAQDVEFQQLCGAPTVDDCAENTTATKTAFVIGDSLGGRLVLLAREGLKKDYDVKYDIASACFAVLVDEIYPSLDKEASCIAHKQAQIADVVRAKPDILFISDSYTPGPRITGSATQSESAKWQAGMTKLLAAVKGSVKQIIIVAPPPQGTGLAQCSATRNSRPSECTSQLSDSWHRFSGAEKRAAQLDGATYWDTSNWYCSTQGQCPILVGDTITMMDNAHPTAQYLHDLVPVFQDKLHSTLSR